jgi:hypothetical protein
MIGRVSTTTLSSARAPYSLEPCTFAFPALASLAGRAPLGGPRELALACILASRILRDTLAVDALLTPEQLQNRIQGAKHWLGSAAIQAPAKTALARLVEASSTGDRSTIRASFDVVMTVTANQLDQGARLELVRLAQAIAG